MATETEQLVVALEARIDQFEKSFKRAAGVSNDNWTAIERRGAQGAKRLEDAFINSGRAAQRMTQLMGNSADVGRQMTALMSLSSAVDKHSASMQLNRLQMMELAHVSRALFDSLASGQHPTRALAMEGGRIAEIFAMGKGGVGGTLAALGGMAAKYVPALVAFGAALAAYETGASTLEKFAEVVERSERAGVSTNLFQGWRDQAERLRLTVEEMEAAIERAGKTLEGQLNPIRQNAGGDLSKRANYLSDFMGKDTESKAAVENAKSVDELHQAALLLVRDYLSASEELRSQNLELESAQRKIDAARIATEVWGEAGKKVVEGIENGSLNVDTFIEKSREAGNVWSADILEAQKKTNQALEEARKHLSDEMKPAFEEIEKISLGVLDAWAGILNRIADAVHKAKELSTSLRSATQELKDREAARNDKGGGPSFKDTFKEYLNPAEAPPIREIDAPLPPSRPNNLDAKPEKAGRSHAEKADQVERLIQSLTRENASLAGEADALGKSNVEREKAIDLARAEEAAKERGRALTDQERASIEQLAESHAQLREKIDAARKADQEFKSALGEFGADLRTSFADAILNGQKLSTVLDTLLKKLASQAFNKGFDAIFSSVTSGLSSGSAGGLFGGLLHFADGGKIEGAGGPRSDSILAAVSNGEFVVNGAATSKYLPLLQALNSGRLPKFADGGLVGAPSLPSLNPTGSVGNKAGSLHVSPTINVQVAGGSQGEEADNKLGKTIATQVEEQIRGVVINEILVQQRPGNLLWREGGR
ncbi:hypothetical protein A1351_13980 [Methylosinus sp. R-45379]|uniref:phage tail length tape measure family protein n=1 Tax=Methylosinus sp. R-45379 TaxID=980563 RepID=UPI0007C89BAF|nr:phage tail length tape measure family protein [Methylosinus sp. R-45379]OAI26947.1 hypothetical protein A1351_13980 [Methylosinus sp. R-45379]